MKDCVKYGVSSFLQIKFLRSIIITPQEYNDIHIPKSNWENKFEK
jgi:hypothetical protein